VATNKFSHVSVVCREVEVREHEAGRSFLLSCALMLKLWLLPLVLHEDYLV
jgi:hypothetical protein